MQYADALQLQLNCNSIFARFTIISPECHYDILVKLF